MPKTIYLEHSAFAHEKWWDDLKQVSARRNDVRFVLSDWNLVEIANAEDEGQAVRRARFADELRPLWMMERSQILKREVRSYVYEHIYRKPADRVQPFSDSLTVMLSYHEGITVPLGETAVLRIQRLQNNRRYLAEINRGKQVTHDAQLAIRKASLKERAQAEPEVFRNWVGTFVPNQAPDGKLLTKTEKRSLTDACFRAGNHFYQSCPAMAVEHSLYVERARDASRQLQLQDAIDFQHSVMALPYCDYFLTRDRHLAHVARAVKANLSTAVAEVTTKIEGLQAALAI